VFKVKVTAVNTLRVMGKTKRFKGHVGQRSDLRSDGDPGRGPHIDVTTESEAMALKTFKPTTPSQRQLVIVDRSDLYKGPGQGVDRGAAQVGGRNNHGTSPPAHGGGHKRRYRTVTSSGVAST